MQVHACMFIEPKFLNICSKLGPALGLLGFENNEGRVHVFKEVTVKLGYLSLKTLTYCHTGPVKLSGFKSLYVNHKNRCFTGCYEDQVIRYMGNGFTIVKHYKK